MILALPDQQFFVRHFNNNQRLTRKGFYAGNSRTEEMTNALSSGCVHWDRAGSFAGGHRAWGWPMTAFLQRLYAHTNTTGTSFFADNSAML